MATDFEAIEAEPRPPRTWLRALILAGVAFAGGAVAMGYALTHWDTAARFLADAPPQTVMTSPSGSPSASGVVDDPARRAVTEKRVADLEARIGAIGARANAAVGNADRAEGLLVAFAARRALDRGVPLGYMEALLRERFGDSQPQAVATIVAAGRQPVTLEDLQSGLADLAPVLAGGGPGESWWDGLRRELAELVILRKANTPSPAPSERLARARRQLDAGRVGAALAEVSRMPGRDQASDWIAKARRYTAARDALDVIETAALVDPSTTTAPPTDNPAKTPAKPSA